MRQLVDELRLLIGTDVGSAQMLKRAREKEKGANVLKAHL